MLTGVGILYTSVAGAPFYWLTAMSGATIAFAVVVVATGTLVALHRSRGQHAPRVGRKGFMDYKIQAMRALDRLPAELAEMTREMNLITTQVSADTKRLTKALGSDERAYRAGLRAARRIDKRATIMRIHAGKFAEDVQLFTEGSEKWFNWMLEAPAAGAGRGEVSQVATLLDGMHTTVCETLSTMRAFAESVEGSRAFSEQMDIACGALLEAVNIFVNSTNSIKVFCEIQGPRLRGTP